MSIEVRYMEKVRSIKVEWVNLPTGDLWELGELQVMGFDGKAIPPSIDDVVARSLAMLRDEGISIDCYRVSIQVASGWVTKVRLSQDLEAEAKRERPR